MTRFNDKDFDERRFNEDLAVYAAMLKAGFKSKPKLSPGTYARRRAREQLVQQRRYCDAFALWKSCRNGVCRRYRACRGDAHACLKRALGSVPPPEQWRAREAIFKATPRNIGAPEREARQFMPYEFYE